MYSIEVSWTNNWAAHLFSQEGEFNWDNPYTSRRTGNRISRSWSSEVDWQLKTWFQLYRRDKVYGIPVQVICGKAAKPATIQLLCWVHSDGLIRILHERNADSIQTVLMWRSAVVLQCLLPKTSVVAALRCYVYWGCQLGTSRLEGWNFTEKESPVRKEPGRTWARIIFDSFVYFPIPSTRVGIMSLGSAYVKLRTIQCLVRGKSKRADPS